MFSPVLLIKWFWVIVLKLELHLICKYLGKSLAVQWLGLHFFTAKDLVKFLVGKLRSCQLHGMARKKNLSCHISTYKVSRFLISVSCLSREKWHWSWDIIKTESRGKIGKLQKKDSHEKPSWRKSSRTVSVIELFLVSSFLYWGMFPGLGHLTWIKRAQTTGVQFFSLN